MKHSLFSKIFGGYVVLIVAIAICFVTVSFDAIREFDVKTVTEGLKSLGVTLAANVVPFLEGGRTKGLDDYIKTLGRDIDTRITVIDPAGVVLADSEKDPSAMENHKNRPEVIEALLCGVGNFCRYSTTVKEDMVYVAVPIKGKDKVLGVLRVSTYSKHIDSLLHALQLSLAKALMVILLLSIVGAFIISRNVTRPIEELRSALEKIAAGEFSVRVLSSGKSEVSELARDFNVMTERIESLFAEVSRQKESLNSIISSIQAALLVLDSKDKIILSNESFKKMIKDSSVEGRFYWESIREMRFGELIKKVRVERKGYTDEVSLSDCVYLCSATPMGTENEIVIILQDITAMKTVEKIKKDFVVNVSHELRTPLTAIKGFAETLGEMADDESRRYAEIIKRNTDRLINIVQDLLLLSELEERGYKPAIEDVTVTDLVENVVKIFRGQFKAKGLEFTLNAERDLPPLQADPFKLEQLFINLLDNAIKYTDKGTIHVSLSRVNGKIRIEVADTGIGISKEHLSRIFERFYVVDKSRSKTLGGTGLGLSIVKHIVALHKGTIAVESSIGVGTKFIVSLPTNPS